MGGATDYTLRRAGAGDVLALGELAQSAGGKSWSMSSVRGELATPHSETLVLAREGSMSIAGLVITWYVADEATVLLIAVDSALRRQGLGRRLLDAVETNARMRAMSVIHLEVRAGNTAARAFYRARGFEETAVRRGYYDDGAEDAVLMRRSLT